MQIAIILISTLLSWTAFDPNLFRRRNHSFTWVAGFSLTHEEEGLQQKKKIQKQNRLDVIPPKYRQIKKPFRGKCNYFSTKPRDVRFSDQMKIRRMFNNA